MRYKRPKLTTEEFMATVIECREDRGEFYDYSKVIYTGTDNKITIICPIHGKFTQLPRDHRRGHGCKQCGKDNYKKTCLEKYGVDNYWKRVDLVQQSMIDKHGVKNPGLMIDHIDKVKTTNLALYGVEWSATTEEVNQRRKTTNMKRYGVDIPMKNRSVSMKMVDTKIKNGGFDVSNSSKEATEYFRKYIQEKGYSVTQVAFADSEYGLSEWGYYFDRWYLYDFVAFEEGYRGDPSKILEIVEWHGPFHYTEEEANERGSEKAAPWASSKMTITESVERDVRKEKFARTLTENYYVVWAEKYHNKRK